LTGGKAFISDAYVVDASQI